jgi:hypothetical protein
VTGAFHSRKAFVDAAEELLVAGFDPAEAAFLRQR